MKQREVIRLMLYNGFKLTKTFGLNASYKNISVLQIIY